MTEMLKGIGASNGVAIAKAYLLVQPDLSFEKTTVEDTDNEKARLDAAIATSTGELQVIRDKAAVSLGEEEAQVFDAHMMVLADPEMIGQIKDNIESNKVNAEQALKEVTDFFISIFENMDDAYMRERAADIKDVTKRVMAHLLGVKLPNPSTINEEVIVIAHDLTPSDTAQLNREFVKAFITNIGGRTSHSAIMARSLEIPAIVGTNNVTELVKDGDMVAANGIEGVAYIHPTKEQMDEITAIGEKFAAQKAEWALLKDAETKTADGVHFELAANIGTPKDVEGVLNNGGEGIGLYRTEFLYMESQDFPTEDEQYEAYKAVLEGMGPDKQVVVRTMDIGGDKELPYFDLPHEMNPFLGYRALRISISEDGKDMFRTQLRALLRASVHGKLRVMFPMVAVVSEFKAAKAIWDEEKAKLLAEGVAVSDDIQVGIMIEIPAAAMIADKFAKHVDFFSIGTNDLIQYTMAADRMNEQVSYLYQPYNPSILRLIDNVIKAAHKEGKWAGMCGEMAGDQTAVPILMGMGLDEFSMSATSILETRSLMKRLTTTKMAELADKALNEAETNEEVIALVKEYVGE